MRLTVYDLIETCISAKCFKRKLPVCEWDVRIRAAIGQHPLFAYCCDYIFVQSAKSHGADVHEYEEFSSVTNIV